MDKFLSSWVTKAYDPLERLPIDEKILRRPTEKTGPWGLHPAEGIAVARNDNLRYNHYIEIKNGAKVCDFFLSDEARDAMQKLGWKDVRRLFEAEFDHVDSDPYGERSIDPHKAEPQAQVLRSVNALSDELEKLLQVPVALKGSGSGKLLNYSSREPLTEQFVYMRKIGIAAEGSFNKEQKEILSICPVYASIRIYTNDPKYEEGYKEWLIMHRVADAQWMHTKPINVLGLVPGIAGIAAPTQCLVAGDHKALLQAFAVDYRGDFVRLGQLADALVLAGLQPRPRDISGRNTLVTKKADGSNHYTLIDLLESQRYDD